MNVKDTFNKVVASVSENKVWNSIFNNPFMLAIIITLCMVLIFIYVYDNQKSVQKNIFTFFIYSIFINTILIMFHDVIINNKIKNIIEKEELKELHGNSNIYNLRGKYDDSLLQVKPSQQNINQQQQLANSYNNSYIINGSNNENSYNSLPPPNPNAVVQMY